MYKYFKKSFGRSWYNDHFKLANNHKLRPTNVGRSLWLSFQCKI